MQVKTKVSIVVLIYALLTACAAHSENHGLVPTLSQNTSLGMVMTDKSGMTLYTFTKDAPGASNCNGNCATAWPPFAAGESARDSGKFTVITRTDGSRQWAYENKPLYTWQGDRAPGDVAGHGVNDAWFAVPVEQASPEKKSSYGSGGYY